MNILQYPDRLNAPELQIWNNAAFVNGVSEDSAVKVSWSSLNPSLVVPSESFDSDFSKENQNPVDLDYPVLVKSTVPTKPLQSNGAIGNSQGKALKSLMKNSCESREEEKDRDETKIDAEIEEIEKEIRRLSTRLETLRLEKVVRSVKITEKKGKIVPAKFMEPKQGVKISEPISSSRTKLNRRGVSMGPVEIFSATQSRQAGKQEMTPVQPIQNRRKSCFWKLQDIDEGKSTRDKSFTVSPKSRKTVSKVEAPKQAMTTVGSKRPVKKEDMILSSIQPKRLFSNGEKPATAKKPAKPGRVVASRYNNDGRKRSLPENDKEEAKRCDKRLASSIGKLSGKPATEGRVKKKWQIPIELVVFKGAEDKGESPPSVDEVGDALPRIRIARSAIDTPRDSGPAKRVAELMGKKSFFCSEEDTEASLCQALDFAEKGEGN